MVLGQASLISVTHLYNVLKKIQIQGDFILTTTCAADNLVQLAFYPCYKFKHDSVSFIPLRTLLTYETGTYLRDNVGESVDIQLKPVIDRF